MKTTHQHIYRTLLGIIFLLVSFNAPLSATEKHRAAKKNLILVLVDDLGWADIGCYGADLHETPNIDKFATTAMKFTNAYAASPICSPTRASIQTGKYPARLQMTIWREQSLRGPSKGRRLIPAKSKPDLPWSEFTIAEAFKQAGYHTTHIGKWHLGGASHYPEAHGFDINIGGSHWGAPATFFYPYRGHWGKNPELRYVPHTEWGKKGEYLTDRLTDEAIKIIQHKKEKPFFLQLSYHTVHTPVEAKAEVVKRYQKKLHHSTHHKNPEYAAMVHALDENFGRLMQALKKSDLEENTTIIFTSDNGGYVNKYKNLQVTNNHPLRSGKGSLYEGGIRIPLLIHSPGVSKAGGRCTVPVITNDLYATCLELCNIKPTAKHDGISLVPLLNETASKLNRNELYFHYPHYYPTTTPVSAVR